MALVVSCSSDLERLSDKCLFPQSVLSAALDSHSPLPHPLVFRLHSDEQSVLVGVKEFTAPEGEIVVPKSIHDVLGDVAVHVELASMPRATFLQLKPIDFYPHITNWKYYLESFVSKSYTVLTKKQKFGVYDSVAKVDVELLVEDANDDLVVVVDTDIDLDVVPLNDIMAAQQLSHNENLAYLENIPVVKWDAPIKLEPYNLIPIPAIHKLDLLAMPPKSYIRLSTSEDLYNVDLVAGTDKFLTLENFAWCTMPQDSSGVKYIEIDKSSDIVANFMQKHSEDTNCWLYLVPFSWDHASTVTLTISSDIVQFLDKQHQQESALPTDIQCSNCLKFIDKNKIVLHEAFCFRNNVRCSCSEVFPKSIPSTHWHCEECNPPAHGNSTLFKIKHEKLYHSGPYKCDQCEDSTVFPDFVALVEIHKATDCGAKLHECIFCHLVVPQGVASYEEKFNNLSHHESKCGNKTIECLECGKVVKSKDLTSHMRIHNLNKVQSAAEVVDRCTNAMCVNIFANAQKPANDLGLCDSCFGPLYAQVHDPTHIKLQNRLERKYVIQLTKGCGNSWCENPECANQKKWDLRLALGHIQKELLAEIFQPSLPINKAREKSENMEDEKANGAGSDKSTSASSSLSSSFSSNKMWFCLNASVDLKRRLYDKIMRDGQYGENMVLKALATNSEEEKVRSWLRAHSI